MGRKEDNKKYYETHKEERLVYQNDYYKRNRKLRIDYQREYFRKLKLWAINKLGNKCLRCGRMMEDFAKIFDTITPEFCFDFHHSVDGYSWSSSNSKTKGIRYKTLRKWRILDKIPEDVKLICVCCHRIIEGGEE